MNFEGVLRLPSLELGRSVSGLKAAPESCCMKEGGNAIRRKLFGLAVDEFRVRRWRSDVDSAQQEGRESAEKGARSRARDTHLEAGRPGAGYRCLATKPVARPRPPCSSSTEISRPESRGRLLADWPDAKLDSQSCSAVPLRGR